MEKGLLKIVLEAINSDPKSICPSFLQERGMWAIHKPVVCRILNVLQVLPANSEVT